VQGLEGSSFEILRLVFRKKLLLTENSKAGPS